jgi:hypothetical protein
MIKAAGFLACVGVLALLPLNAGASSPYDGATGSGERAAVPGFGARKISFGAHDGPNGPSGHAHSQGIGMGAEFNDASGHVTCLLVDGNRAVIGFEAEQVGLEEREGWTYMFAVEDNGNPSDATPDRLSVSFVGPPDLLDPEDCTVGQALYATFAPITSGNFNVQDATP